MNKKILLCNNLVKSFKAVGSGIHDSSGNNAQSESAKDNGITNPNGDGYLVILNGVNLCIEHGESVAITGVSGSGKSTLLHCLGGLDEVSSGDIYIDGHNLQEYSESQRNQMRMKKMGFIYQFHYLIPELSAAENAALPLMVDGIARKDAMQRANEALALVDLSARSEHCPAQLSGGERQRVAVARAIVHNPAMVLADEPTGSLDNENASRVWQTIRKLCTEAKTSLLLVTHDLKIASQCDRHLKLENGELVS